MKPIPPIFLCLAAALLLTSATFGQQRPSSSITIGSQELSRPARPWEFVDAVGTRAALLGNESGRFEAWVYPLKILRDFDVVFRLASRTVPAASMVRRLTMRPEGPTLTFASDSFTVDETWLVPPEEKGAIVRFEISSWEPVQIAVAFQRDFQLMWPAGLGGTYMSWSPELHAFRLGEEGRRFAALVGSKSATEGKEEFSSNSYASTKSSFRLPQVEKGSAVQYVVIAGSSEGPEEAAKTYARLQQDPPALFASARQYYEKYLARTLSLELPDTILQSAYDWSRISTIQGLVTNPFLGTGLVAGYRTSGETARPGFAWFFGRDSLWTDLALDSIGDFSTVRTALDFLAKFQRQDGKVEHEISQTASLVDWFKGFPYAYASADATPLFILAMNDYVIASGDAAFAREHWNNISRAYQFLKSTYDQDGLPRNLGVGHGWVEGGPLLPVETESYQSGLGAAAVCAFESLQATTGKSSEAAASPAQCQSQRNKVNDAFWDANLRSLVFALDKNHKQVPTTTVLSTAPMWFDVFDADKANAAIDLLADWDQAADWGMRIISDQHPLFGPTGYHFGSVWPLFTGWASVAEYRYHRPIEAYANLRANSLLALDGSLGHVTEVLSGSYYEGLGTASPHQIWSSAMVISPIVRGMLGLAIDEEHKRVTLAPHLPANWNQFAMRGIPACGGLYGIGFHRDRQVLKLKLEGTATECRFEISPAISLHARVVGATLNGKNIAYRVQPSGNDQHVSVEAEPPAEIEIQVANDFGIVADEDLPPLGSESSNIKIFREQWSADRKQLKLKVAGVSGRSYLLRAYGARIAQALGAELKTASNDVQTIEVTIPAGPQEKDRYVQTEIRLRF